MSRKLLISMLAAGNTGDEMLTILDTIVNNNVDNSTEDSSAGYNEPTSEFIDFW